MFESMPEPHATIVKSGKSAYSSSPQREAKTTWVLNPEQDGVPQVTVTLTTYHYADRKQFSSALTWGTKEPAGNGSVFSVETWSSDHAMIRVHTVPVARYSVKALEQHHAEALAATVDHWEGTKRVFTEAFTESGLGEEAGV